MLHSLYHISNWDGVAHATVGDQFVLQPGPQGAEGPGVYFSQDTPVRVTTAEGTQRTFGTPTVVKVYVDSATGWWRTKPATARKFNRPITWHTAGKSLRCTVLAQGSTFVAGAGTLPMLECACVLQEPRHNVQKAPDRAARASISPADLIPSPVYSGPLYGERLENLQDDYLDLESDKVHWSGDFVTLGENRVSAWITDLGTVGISTWRGHGVPVTWVAIGHTLAAPLYPVQLLGYPRYSGRGSARGGLKRRTPWILFRRHLSPGVLGPNFGQGLGPILTFAQAVGVFLYGGDGTWSQVGMRSLSAENMSVRLAKQGLYYRFLVSGVAGSAPTELEALLGTTVLGLGVFTDVNAEFVPPGTKVRLYTG